MATLEQFPHLCIAQLAHLCAIHFANVIAHIIQFTNQNNKTYEIFAENHKIHAVFYDY